MLKLTTRIMPPNMASDKTSNWKFIFLCPLLFLAAVSVQAEIVADLTANFQKGKFPFGWSFMWNSRGPIGKMGNYTELLPAHASGGDVPAWSVEGGALPAQHNIQGAYVHVMSKDGVVMTHPGGNGPDSKYVIFAYKISKPGRYRIVNSKLNSLYGGAEGGSGEDQQFVKDGQDFIVFVSDKRILAGTFAWENPANCNADLGALVAGDHVFVAIGPNKLGGYDSCSIQFQLDLTPAGLFSK